MDTEVRAGAVASGEFGYHFQPDEELVKLTVQLTSEDFEIYTDPQQLRVPRTGQSKNNAHFSIEPKHEGEGIINAVFLKDGNFIQLMTIKLQTGGQVGVLSAETLGRPVEAAFVVQPRDVNLTILHRGDRFEIIFSGAVRAMASLSITLQQLDNMIAQLRQDFLRHVDRILGDKINANSFRPN